MGLDVWFREDVARILAATQQTAGGTLSAVTPSCPQEAATYQKGFSDALVAVGVAFGVVMPTSLRQVSCHEGQRILDTGLVHEGRMKVQAGWHMEGCGS